MTIARTGLGANVLGALLLVAGVQLDAVTLQQLSDYLALLGIVVAPTKITAVLGIVGLVINQVLLAKQAAAVTQGKS